MDANTFIRSGYMRVLSEVTKMDKEKIKNNLEELEKQLNASTNPELLEYGKKLKEILDALRKEEKEEGEVADEEPRKGRIIEAACDMATVSA